MQTTFSRQNFGRLRVKSFSFDLSNILNGNKYGFSHVMAQILNRFLDGLLKNYGLQSIYTNLLVLVYSI